MKNLILVGGAMGVGKTTTCRLLMNRLPACAFLDGDWCWSMAPFVVTEETKAMVLDNITHLLNNFLHCSAYENVVFCWVMHDQSIIDDVLGRLDTQDARVTCLSLVCSEDALRRRLIRDVEAGRRTPDVIPRAIQYLKRYELLDTFHLDVSALTPEEAAQRIAVLTGCE